MPRAQDFVTERLRLRHLLLMRALASTSSLRKAGLILGISQPAATKLLSEIERGFQTKLFTRSPTGVAPTDMGTAVIRAANYILAETESVRDEVVALRGGSYGRVRVGVFAIAANEIISDAVLDLRKSIPNLSIRIEEGTASAVLSAVQRAELDCAIGRATSTHNLELPRYPLRQERVLLMARRAHPLRHRKRLHLRDVVREQWILPNREAVLRHAIEIALAERGLHLPDCALECSALALNESLVKHTNALCPVPESAARRLQSHHELCTLPMSLTIAMPPVVVWTRHPPPYRPSVQKFIEAAMAASRALGGTLFVSPLRPGAHSHTEERSVA